MLLEQCHVIISKNIINAYVLVNDNGYGYKVYTKDHNDLKSIDFDYIMRYGSRIYDYERIKNIFNIKEEEFIIH